VNGPRFHTLLVANRGEIACRILRSAHRLGLRTVAVYSDADRDALHVSLATRAVRIGPGPSAQSYLDIEAILDAARRSGAGAIHPGYGFLSENPAFAAACEAAEIVFVGPPAAAIEALGNKTAAKRLAARLGVPCLAGADERDGEDLVRAARRHGAPLMIKAAGGGGGRGMRRVDDLDRFDTELASARAEARAAFGNGEMLVERCIDDARHVEIQVIGDEHGAFLHLGERDCSSQRRRQKVIEEAPAPGVDGDLRERMGEAAIALARGVGYRNAGTVEFLLEPNGTFHFLEMNTRLQVEHPVTEAVTGIDLVELQLRVAQGEHLPLSQADVRLDGWAIEARLCAEDPWRGFAPQPGPVVGWSFPAGHGIRCDHGLADRATIPPFYDSLVAKVVAHGPDRESARLRLLDALSDTHVHGLVTNRDYLVAALRHDRFVHARLGTDWLESAGIEGTPPLPDSRWLALAAALLVERRSRPHGWLAHWSPSGPMERPVELRVADRSFALRLLRAGPGQWRAWAAGARERALLLELPGAGRVCLDGLEQGFDAIVDDSGGHLDAFGYSGAFADDAPRPPRRESAGSGAMSAGMHGLLASVQVEAGDIVDRGDPLFSIEAMKMNHRTDAPFRAKVLEVCARPGQQVAPDQVVVRLEPVDPAGASITNRNGDQS